MINVVLWLGNAKCPNEFAMTFARKDIRIVGDGFNSADDFWTYVSSIEDAVDVIVIAEHVMQSLDQASLLRKLKAAFPSSRIVLIFQGYRNHYTSPQTAEYKSTYGITDIIFEGIGLSDEYLADVIRKRYP